MSEPTMQTVMERLDRLERELRWWKRLGGASAVGLALIIVLGATGAGVPDEIRARRFVVVASDGRSLGRLGTSPDGSPELVLYDSKGIERAILVLSQGAEPMLHLRNEDNTLGATIRVDHITLETKSAHGLGTSASMTSDALGSPGIRLSKPDGDATLSFVLGGPSLALTSASSGNPGIRLSKPDGDATLSFVLGGPHLALSHGSKQRAVVGLDLDGSPEIALSDEAGKQRAILGRTSLEETPTGMMSMRRPESSLVLFDKDGKVIWQAP